MLLDGAAIGLGPLLERVDRAKRGRVQRYRIGARSEVYHVRDKPGGTVIGTRPQGRILRADMELQGWVRLQEDFYRSGCAEPLEGWAQVSGFAHGVAPVLERWEPPAAAAAAIGGAAEQGTHTTRFWVVSPSGAVVRERPWGRVLDLKRRGMLLRSDVQRDGCSPPAAPTTSPLPHPRRRAAAAPTTRFRRSRPLSLQAPLRACARLPSDPLCRGAASFLTCGGGAQVGPSRGGLCGERAPVAGWGGGDGLAAARGVGPHRRPRRWRRAAAAPAQRRGGAARGGGEARGGRGRSEARGEARCSRCARRGLVRLEASRRAEAVRRRRRRAARCGRGGPRGPHRRRLARRPPRRAQGPRRDEAGAEGQAGDACAAL